jgi:hypothetical protein
MAKDPFKALRARSPVHVLESIGRALQEGQTSRPELIVGLISGHKMNCQLIATEPPPEPRGERSFMFLSLDSGRSDLFYVSAEHIEYVIVRRAEDYLEQLP